MRKASVLGSILGNRTHVKGAVPRKSLLLRFESCDIWLSLLFPALVLAAWLYYPLSGNGPILCPWRFFLGVECPSCGLTRAMCAISRGEFSLAARLNLLAFPGMIAAFVFSMKSISALLVNLRRMWR